MIKKISGNVPTKPGSLRSTSSVKLRLSVSRKPGSSRSTSSGEARIPSVYSICYKIFLLAFCCFFFREILLNCILGLMSPFICFISLQIVLDGCILGAISGSTYVTSVDVI